MFHVSAMPQVLSGLSYLHDEKQCVLDAVSAAEAFNPAGPRGEAFRGGSCSVTGARSSTQQPEPVGSEPTGPSPSDTGPTLTSCLALGCARCRPVLDFPPALQLLPGLSIWPWKEGLEGLGAAVPGPQVLPPAPFYLLQGCKDACTCHCQQRRAVMGAGLWPNWQHHSCRDTARGMAPTVPVATYTSHAHSARGTALWRGGRGPEA